MGGVPDREPTGEPPDGRPGGLTRLVIPVPEIGLAGARIALLDPFLDALQVDEGIISELRELFAGIVPFTFVLGEPARFPSGAAYLPPEPVGVFRRIAQSLRHTFPEAVGDHPSLPASIPHLPLADKELDAVPAPLEVHAREALLTMCTDGQERVLATFPFGTSAA